MTKSNLSPIMALDVGNRRIGVAIVTRDLTIPRSLGVIDLNEDDVWDELKMLCSEHKVEKIVVGLPRGLNGQETAQTKNAQEFAEEVEENTKIAVSMQDEALTSVEAEKILKNSGKPYEKADVDSLSASLILEDYLQQAGVL